MARSAAKTTSGRRDLIRRGSASAYAKRTKGGQFREMDDVGRSQRADRPRAAKTTVRSGYGDQGDTKSGAPASRKKTGARKAGSRKSAVKSVARKSSARKTAAKATTRKTSARKSASRKTAKRRA